MYIIGSRDKATQSQYSISSTPAQHPTVNLAEKEAARLATKDPSREFIVYKMISVASVQDVVVKRF